MSIAPPNKLLKADGRASSLPAVSSLSPVVEYHGLARRHLMPAGFSCGRSLTAVRWADRKDVLIAKPPMTIWHFKGELIKADDTVATYRFYPDHVMAPAVSGVFEVDLQTFEPRIIEPADAEARGLVSNDEHCVSALAHKIRKAVSTSGAPPSVEFFVA